MFYINLHYEYMKYPNFNFMNIYDVYTCL